MERVRAGVVGAGVFGGYHAGKYVADDRVDLVGVFDIHPDRAEALAGAHGARAFATLDTLIEAIDVLTVAAPAPGHAAAALAALEAGVHVLVEKPIAVRPDDGARMIASADARGLVLQVGHQERFVFAAMGLLDVDEAPRRIEARRFGPWARRGSDVSVTLDLMTHDIDLARVLARRAPVASVTGRTWRERSDGPDRSRAVIDFEGGTEAVLEASRLHDRRERTMRIEFARGVVEVDFVAKTFSNTSGHRLNADFAEHPDARDSLGAGVRAFISAVRGEGPPAVSGADGLAALTIACAVDAAGAEATA